MQDTRALWGVRLTRVQRGSYPLGYIQAVAHTFVYWVYGEVDI